MMRRLILLILTIQMASFSYSQDDHILNEVHKHLTLKQQEWKLTKVDIQGFRISSFHTSQHNGVTHVYFEQTVRDIPVFGALNNLNISKDGALLLASNNFFSDAINKINEHTPQKTPIDAIQFFKKHHNLTSEVLPRQLKSVGHRHEYQSVDISDKTIKADLMYYPTESGTLRLVWKIEADIKESTDYWSSLIDAKTLNHLQSFSHTSSCYFHKHSYTNHDRICWDDHKINHEVGVQSDQESINDGSSYLVYPLPLENPNEGDQTLLQEPALAMASPFGWHDTDGIDGPEFTITRGNNAHAYQNAQGGGNSKDDEPDGGQNLQFQFGHDKLGEPEENLDSDVTQLFYISNWMHDFSYFFGFDEAAGNFQENNFNNPGEGGDYVIARALERRLDDGVPETNNARFSTPSDGNSGVMFMFPWVASDTDVFLTSPARKEIIHGNPAFGIPENTEITEGQIAISIDSGGVSTLDACESIINPAELAGKIAFVERGTCDFSFKVHKLQEAGAIGVVICNRDEEIVNMGAGENAQLVNIFSVHLRKSDCDTIKTALNAGENVMMELSFKLPTPKQVSGSFDNGVTVHEYGHGISIRMTGGRNNSSCLRGDEQMGEGWSDFFSLVATHKAGDKGEDTRGLGTYLERFTSDPNGIRRQFYSTDPALNDQTYNDIRFTGFDALLAGGGRRGEHEVGEIWVSALWDMYWLFVDTYGFDEDWTNTESGNHKAIQLVFDGLKFQTCNPGFVTGRDAILAADIANSNGENECLIWEAFAKRGVGFDADQGSAFEREDGTEGYLTAPKCQQKLVINKEATPLVEAGDMIDISITVSNNTDETLTNVSVLDVVPEGSLAITLDEFNIDYQDGDRDIEFTLGSLEPLQSVVIAYQLTTATDNISKHILFDDFDSSNAIAQSLFGDITWNLEADINEGPSWVIPGNVEVFDQVLQLENPIIVSGEMPVFQFRHQYEVELFFAGSDIELSSDGGTTWASVTKDKFLSNGYNDEVIFKGRDELGFTGDSEGYVESVIDLSEYLNQTILLRFRFTSNVGGGIAEVASATPGWSISNYRVYDMNAYNLNDACVGADGKEDVCDGATTIIEGDESSPTNDELKAEYNFSLFPNPTSGLIQIQLNTNTFEHAVLRISNLSGQTMSIQPIQILGRDQTEILDLSQYSSGMYILEVISNTARIADKVIISGNG